MKNYATFLKQDEDVTTIKVVTINTEPSKEQRLIISEHMEALEKHDILPMTDGKRVMLLNKETLEQSTIELVEPKPIKKFNYEK